jgi:hypothetical protein
MTIISNNLGLNIPEGSDVFNYDTFLKQNFEKIDTSLADIASLNNYSVIPTYTNGQLTKVEEKDGQTVKASSTLAYNPDGTVNTVTEVINGKTVVSTLNYVNGEFSSITREVL